MPRWLTAGLVAIIAVSGCAAGNDGPVSYGPTLLQAPSSSTPTGSLPPGFTRLTTAKYGLIVQPVGSSTMCQLGANVTRGSGADQVRYAIVGKDCAAPVGTRIQDVNYKDALGAVAATIAGKDGAWSAVAVRLDDGVGWMSVGPPAVVRSGDEVEVHNTGQTFHVTIDARGLLLLDGFSPPFGRSGASVFTTKGRLVGISAGAGSLAVPIAELLRTLSAVPGFDGVTLM